MGKTLRFAIVGLLILALGVLAGWLARTATVNSTQVKKDKQIEQSIKHSDHGEYFDTPISQKAAETILGRPPADMSEYFQHSYLLSSSKNSRTRMMGETVYRATKISDLCWVSQLWYQDGDPPAFVEIHQIPAVSHTTTGLRKIKLSNGATADIWSNNILEDGKPLEPEWVNNLWHLLWIKDGVTNQIEAANIDENKLIEIANAIK